jgi:putative endonuclease
VTRSTGHAAEDAALAHLQAQGLRLRARNYTCRWGEIDLVMETNRQIVFIEVRYRATNAYGGARASIDARKRQRLVRSAADYLRRQRLGDRPARFDVVAVTADTQIDWIPAAFDAD